MLRKLTGFLLMIVILLTSQWLVAFFDLPLPGNVVGMLLLFVFLLTGLVPLKWVAEAADFLLAHMSLFFIPAAIGVLAYQELLAPHLLALALLLVVTTLAVMGLTGRLAQWAQRGERSR